MTYRKFLSGNTELTACTDHNPFYRESMPENRKRSSEMVENDPSKATPPALSKLSKEDNPPFFVYLTRSQKQEYKSERIEPDIRGALYMFTDPMIRSGCRKGARTYHDNAESTTDFTFVAKDDCPLCNFPIDPMTLKSIYTRICPVPGCAHSYVNRREDEKVYLRNFDSHDCEKVLHIDGHMKNYERPELPGINIDSKLTSEEISKNVIESAQFANWKTHIDRKAALRITTHAKKLSITKPVYIAPIKVKATPRQGLKRTKRAV